MLRRLLDFVPVIALIVGMWALFSAFGPQDLSAIVSPPSVQHEADCIEQRQLGKEPCPGEKVEFVRPVEEEGGFASDAPPKDLPKGAPAREGEAARGGVRGLP